MFTFTGARPGRCFQPGVRDSPFVIEWGKGPLALFASGAVRLFCAIPDRILRLFLKPVPEVIRRTPQQEGSFAIFKQLKTARCQRIRLVVFRDQRKILCRRQIKFLAQTFMLQDLFAPALWFGKIVREIAVL